MGQYESKQKLQQMTNSLSKIQKDVRNGKITSKDVQKIQEVLNYYSNEIEINLSKHLRATDVYNVEQLIESTSKLLNALKDENNYDQTAVPANSFRRSYTRNSNKEKQKCVKDIVQEVEDIRKLIRLGEISPQDHDRLQRSLVGYSQQLSSSKKAKKQDVEAGQKLISSVTEELLIKQTGNNENATNIGRSQESVPAKKVQRLSRPVSIESELSRTTKTNSLTRSSKIKQEPPKIFNRTNSGNLDDVEKKLETLKNDIKVAENNKDRNRLHFLAKSVQTLMTHLQMVNVDDDILSQERKTMLEQNLIRIYQQVDKNKKHLATENNINYLSKLRIKEKREQQLQDLEEIEQSVLFIGKNLSHENFQAEKETFDVYKSRLSSIEETSEDVTKKKKQVLDAVLQIESNFERFEAEKRLHEAEWLHYQNRVDLKNLTQTPDSDTFRKHHKYLQRLRNIVAEIPAINQKIEEKKQYVLYNVESNIAALEKKVNDNVSKSQKAVKETVALRKTEPSTVSILNNLVNSCNELNQHLVISGSLDEQNDVYAKLTDAKRIIDDKLVALTNQMTRRNLPESDTVDSLSVASIELKNLQKELLSLQRHIENSHYFKDTPLYNDMKNKVENCKTELSKSLKLDHDNGSFIESLLKYADNVLVLLESKTTNRKSISDDISVEIMTINSRVNNLGNKIQGLNYTIQDYAAIKSGLIEHKQYLQRLQIPPVRTNLIASRDETLQQIDQHLSDLEALKRGDNLTSEEEMNFNKELRKAKDKVARYSGTYKNVLYKSIERDLDKCLAKIENVFKDSSVAVKVKTDIKNNKMILEQKSIKDRQYDSLKHENSNAGRRELIEIKGNVESVKQALSGSESLSQKELDQLDAKLTLSLLALDNFKYDRLRVEKDQLYKEVDYYFARIQDLISAKRQPASDQGNDQVAANLLATVESDLERLKPQILTFVGSETSTDFVELDEILVRDTIQTSNLIVDEGSELEKIKLKLMSEMQKYCDILDERVQQTEKLETLEKEVQVMLIKLDSFNGYFGDSEYASLDEQIIKLKVNLSKLEVNQELAARKTTCMKEIDNCMKKLKQVVRTEGTLV